MLNENIFFRYHFICQKWLSDDADGGMISREIPAAEDEAFRLANARAANSRASGDFALERKGKCSTKTIRFELIRTIGNLIRFCFVFLFSL